MNGIRLVATPIHNLGFAAIGAAYMGIGASFDESARVVVVTNTTNETLMFSWDGINDHFPVYTDAAFVITIAQNSTAPDEYFALSADSRLYVKEIVSPVSGSVYVSQFRGDQDAG